MRRLCEMAPHNNNHHVTPGRSHNSNQHQSHHPNSNHHYQHPSPTKHQQNHNINTSGSQSHPFHHTPRNQYYNTYHNSNYISTQNDVSPAVPHRTTNDINLSVLQKYCSAVTSVIATAAYCVVYVYKKGWEKSGVEGTLFVVGLEGSIPPRTGIFATKEFPSRRGRGGRRSRGARGRGGRNNVNGGERESGSTKQQLYQLMILNRKGLDNFFLPIPSPEDIDINGDYLNLRAKDALGANNGCMNGGGTNGNSGTPPAQDEESLGYGLWIYTDSLSTAGQREKIINVVKDLAEIIKDAKEETPKTPTMSTFVSELESPTPARGVIDEGALAALTGEETEAELEAETEVEEAQEQVPKAGKSISLTDLFRRQREEDAGFALHRHVEASHQQASPAPNSMPPPPQFFPHQLSQENSSEKLPFTIYTDETADRTPPPFQGFGNLAVAPPMNLNTPVQISTTTISQQTQMTLPPPPQYLPQLHQDHRHYTPPLPRIHYGVPPTPLINYSTQPLPHHIQNLSTAKLLPSSMPNFPNGYASYPQPTISHLHPQQFPGYSINHPPPPGQHVPTQTTATQISTTTTPIAQTGVPLTSLQQPQLQMQNNFAGLDLLNKLLNGANLSGQGGGQGT